MINYKGKNVLITGASMGIGKGLSLCFARDGAHLALTDLPQEKDRLESWAEELRKTYGITVWTFYGDLTEKGGPEKLHAEVKAAVGTINALVNNAGIAWYGLFKDMPPARFEKLLLLNCMAYTKLTRLVLPDMVARNEGGILNVSSGTAFAPLPTMTVYGASKAYTQSFTEGVRLELPRGSKVVITALDPPFVRTPLIKDSGYPSDYLLIVLTVVEVDKVTELGYRAFKKGNIRYVHGLLSKLLIFVVVRFIPRRWSNGLIWLLTHRLSDFLPKPVVSWILKLRSLETER